MDGRLELDSLVIEVTRKCSLKCEHCLRGDAQFLSLPIEYADILFERVCSVSCITFTGGEPALVPGLLQQIRHSTEKHNVEIGNFYIATSTAVPESTFRTFVLECLEWHLFCNDNEISQVNWSNDSFHELNTRNVSLLKLLSFTSPRFLKLQMTNYDSLISEGRAANMGTLPPRDDGFTIEDGRITKGIVYLNCRGEILSGCDWSYRNQWKHKVCNVDGLTIEAIAEYARKLESAKKGGD